MIRRILVAVDFRQPSLAAARWAVTHLSPAAVELAHVSRENAVPALQGLAATLRGGSITVRSLQGAPHQALAERARMIDADLVVLGREVPGPSRGGTLERVARSAEAPVLAVGGLASAKPQRVIAAVDASPLGSAIVRCASHLARRLHAELTVLPGVREEAMLASLLAASPASPVLTVVGRDGADVVLRAAPGPVVIVPGADTWLIDGAGRHRPSEQVSVA